MGFLFKGVDIFDVNDLGKKEILEKEIEFERYILYWIKWRKGFFLFVWVRIDYLGLDV